MLRSIACAMLIAQITDIHLGFEPDNPAEFNRKRLDQVLKQLRAMTPKPDMLIATGDLTEFGDADSYRRLKNAFEQIECPVWPMVGNHDDAMPALASTCQPCLTGRADRRDGLCRMVAKNAVDTQRAEPLDF